MRTAIVLAALLSLCAVPAFADPAQNGPWLTAISLVNPDAKPVTDHWDYVNPNAPKGGLVRLNAFGGFDTFNPILPEGEPAQSLYVRTPVEVVMEGGEALEAWAYFYNAPLGRAQRITSGDYLEHLNVQK